MKAQILLLPAAILVWLSCTVSTAPQVDGGGGSEVEITGSVLTPNGAPAAHATVRLRPADYLASESRGLGKSVASIADATTEADGRFLIGGIAAGSYTIEVTDELTAAVLISCEVTAGDDTLDLGTHAIAPFATLNGAVAPESAVGGVDVRIYGLERSASIDSLTGAWSISDLPPGAFTVRVSTASPEIGAIIIDAPPVSSGSSLDLPPVTLVRFTEEDYSQWTFSQTLQINTSSSGANISGDVYGFPLLVRLSTTNFSFPSARADGRDVRFSRQDGTPLRYEIEQWDASAHQAAIWVLIDTIHGNDSTQSFTLHWGEPDAADFSNGAAVFDTSNGFVAVWHFGAGDYRRDAAFNRMHLVDSGTGGSTGTIATCRTFNGSAFMRVPADPLLEPQRITLSCWFTRDELQNPWAKIISEGRSFLPKGGSTDMGAYNSYSIELRNSPDIVGFQIATPDTANAFVESPLSGARIVSRYVTAAFDSLTGQGALYIDGALAGSFTGAPAILYPNDALYDIFIGCQRSPSDHLGGAFYRGSIDEVRLERLVRSAAWIALCYQNQKIGSTIVSLR